LECFFEPQSFNITISSGQVSKIQFLHSKQCCLIAEKYQSHKISTQSNGVSSEIFLKFKVFGRKSLPAKAIVFLPQMLWPLLMVTRTNLDLLSAFKHQLESLDQKLVNESFRGVWMRMLDNTCMKSYKITKNTTHVTL